MRQTSATIDKCWTGDRQGRPPVFQTSPSFKQTHPSSRPVRQPGLSSKQGHLVTALLSWSQNPTSLAARFYLRRRSRHSRVSIDDIVDQLSTCISTFCVAEATCNQWTTKGA
eukprot:351952-Chlamydomonas_euryale.AAC.4